MKIHKLKKKRAVALLSVLLVAVVAMGGTMAYLTDNTAPFTNRFSFPKDADGLSAMLTESYWDGALEYKKYGDKMVPVYAYTEDEENPLPVYGYYSSGNRITDLAEAAASSLTDIRPKLNPNRADGSYGVDIAKNMLPGTVAYKNPKVTNTCSFTSEWVALLLTFVYTDDYTYTDEHGVEVTEPLKGKPLTADDMQIINNVITIKGWNADWVDVTENYTSEGGKEPYQLYYYKHKLVSNESTPSLFESVSVSEGTSDIIYKALGRLKQTGFAIYIEGFAAQEQFAANFTEFSAKTAASSNSFDADIKFNNTPTNDHPLSGETLSVICSPAN